MKDQISKLKGCLQKNQNYWFIPSAIRDFLFCSLRPGSPPAALTQTVENRSCKPDDPGARPGGGSVEVTHYSPQCVTAGSNPAGMESSDFSDERVGGPQWTGGGIGRHKRECHPEQGKVRGW